MDVVTAGREEANALAAMWAASEEAYNQKRPPENRAAWIAFHETQAERIERAAAELAARYRGTAASLLEGIGEGVAS